MELLGWFAATVAGWILKKGLDAMWDRWKRRRATPLNNAQVLAAHRRDFVAAVLLIAWCCVMALWAAVTLGTQGGIAPLIALAGFAALGVIAVRSAKRRLVRVREARARLDHFG